MERLAALASDPSGRLPRPDTDPSDGTPEHRQPEAERLDADIESNIESDVEPVPGGPRWYRKRIGRWGVPLGLLPMAVLGLVSAVILWASDATIAGAAGLWLGCAAAPMLLVFGAPFGDSDLYPIAVALSVPVWLAVGWLAGRRTSRRPAPSWQIYAAELAQLSGAVLIGSGIALGLASWWLGDGLIT